MTVNTLNDTVVTKKQLNTLKASFKQELKTCEDAIVAELKKLGELITSRRERS